MSTRRFDTLTRTLNSDLSRRTALGTALSGLVGAVAGVPEAAAKKRCKGGKKACRGRCVNVKKSTRNCGRCGNRCGWKQRCANGTCRYPNGYPFVTRWGSFGDGEGQFEAVMAVAVDPDGQRVLVPDYLRNQVQVFRNSGRLITQFGSGSTGTGNNDLAGPYGIAVSQANQRIYIAESGNQRIKVLDLDGGFVAHWGPDLGGGQSLDGLFGVAVSPNGQRIYVTEPAQHRIRVLTRDGVIFNTWQGPSPGSSGRLDFNFPTGVAVSPDNRRIYVADAQNDRIKVLAQDGGVLAVWGGRDDDGESRFSLASGVTVDGSGRVYIIDAGHARLSVLTPNGTTLGTFGTRGAGNRQFDGPSGLAAAPGGVVYVADTNNFRIQKLKF